MVARATGRLSERRALAAFSQCINIAIIMAKQVSLMFYLNKKKRVEEEDTPLPSSAESTQPSSSDSLTHKKASQALVAAAACSLAAVSVLSPGQPDAGLPADLTAIDEPPSQPNLKVFPCTFKNGKSRSFSSKWYGQFSWLEYSVTKDATFCKMCRHFPSAADSPFAREGLRMLN